MFFYFFGLVHGIGDYKRALGKKELGDDDWFYCHLIISWLEHTTSYSFWKLFLGNFVFLLFFLVGFLFSKLLGFFFFFVFLFFSFFDVHFTFVLFDLICNLFILFIQSSSINLIFRLLWLSSLSFLFFFVFFMTIKKRNV